MSSIALWWIRRDLRLSDNQPLAAAQAQAGQEALGALHDGSPARHGVHRSGPHVVVLARAVRPLGA